MQARGVPTLATHGLNFGIELVDQSGHGQVSAVVAGLVERDTQILAHPVDGETEVVLVFAHGRPAVAHLPGTGGAGRNGAEHQAGVEIGAFGEMQGLGNALDRAGDGDLIAHFSGLTSSGFAQVGDRLGIGFEQFDNVVEAAFGTAGHDRQLAVDGAGLTT